VGQAAGVGRGGGGAGGAGRPDGQRPRRGPVYGTRVRGGGAAAPLLPSEHGRRPSHGAAGPRRVPARGRGRGERRVRTVMGIESSCDGTGGAGARGDDDGGGEVLSYLAAS